MLPYTFFNDVEKRLKYILYTDTDSLFIHIPKKYNFENPAESIELVGKIAESINNQIINFLNSYVLPKLGIDPKYNETFFKTEIISNAIFFLGTKKNYAYRLLSKENVEVPAKPVKYTGLIKKSDIVRYTKEILKQLIEDIMFDVSLSAQEKKDASSRLMTKYYNIIQKDINDLNVENLGQRKKWSVKVKDNNDTYQITSMRLYNTITQEPLFKPMMGGLVLPIIIDNPTLFLNKINQIKNLNEMYLNDTPLNRITYIAFPYGDFDKEKVKAAMQEYTIKINIEKIWSIIANKVINDVMQLFSQYCNPLLQNKISRIQ